MPNIQISDALFARLQSHAIPLIDDIEVLIARIVDGYEKAEQSAHMAVASSAPQIRAFNPKSPPNLAFSRLMSVTINGKDLPHSGKLYWNDIMYAVVGLAVGAGLDSNQLLALMIVPSVIGEKTDKGYKHLSAAGISIQKQDANGAWKQIYRIADHLGLKLEVVWFWDVDPKAALPGQRGAFTVG